MWAAARPKWWGFLCETTTDNCLARTRRTHLGGRAEIHFPLSPELLMTMCAHVAFCWRKNYDNS
jgi:hypothetical protein